MFTGIVEEVGVVASLKRGARSCVLTIRAAEVLSDVHAGDSIAVNGVCLTVTGFAADRFSADVMNETLDRSSLGRLRPGMRVNLERAMPANGRFGGHIVSGHIDGVGNILSVREDGNAVWFTIEAAPSVLALIVEKGSVAIDGISLTVARVDSSSFAVSVIPHTRAVTNLASKGPGDVVNLENDVVGKYVERLLGIAHGAGGAVFDGGAKGVESGASAARKEAASSGLTREFLLENGF